MESLEFKLLKSSNIEDGDILIIKISENDKKFLTKEKVQNLYNQIKNMIKKDVPMYFFPKNLDIDIIKKSINNVDYELQENNKNID